MTAQTFSGPAVGWFALSPLLALLGGALVLLVVGALTPRWPRGLYAFVSALSAGTAGALSMVVWDDVSDRGARTLMGGVLMQDGLAMFVAIAIAAALVLTSLLADDYLRREDLDGPEHYALMLLAAIGAVVMAWANDFVVMFIGLEVLSLALYTMAASHRRRSQSQESGLKYFVLGGFASAFFLYGIALLYGATGSTNFTDIADRFTTVVQVERTDGLVLAGVALLIVGLAFKVAAVPFHFWAPDVYQGAPTPMTAYMASIGKTAAFAAMLRVLVYVLPSRSDDWRPAIWLLAVLTLVIGSTLAVVQTDVKRMLAYSSISHAGFIFVGVEAAGHMSADGVGAGVSASVLYLLLYSVLVVGTFAVVTLVSRAGDGQTSLAAFRGLGRQRPALALGLTVLLLAQAGVPLTSGFIAKFGVIRAAVDEQSYAIAIIAMLASVIAAYLYLRIMISMWVAEPEAGDDERDEVRVPLSTGLAITAAVAFTLIVGFVPGWIIDASEQATAVVRAIAG